MGSRTFLHTVTRDELLESEASKAGLQAVEQQLSAWVDQGLLAKTTHSDIWNRRDLPSSGPRVVSGTFVSVSPPNETAAAELRRGWPYRPSHSWHRRDGIDAFFAHRNEMTKAGGYHHFWVLLHKEPHAEATRLSNIALIPTDALKSRCLRIDSQAVLSEMHRSPDVTEDGGCLGLRASEGGCAKECANSECAEIANVQGGRACIGCSSMCLCSPSASDYEESARRHCERKMHYGLNKLHHALNQKGQCEPELAPGDGVFFLDEIIHRTQDFALNRAAISFDLI
jgi:hypothetical protein